MTSANAVYQMLFAYQLNPNSFEDDYLANGEKGENGIPDILDEAKWGLDWLDKMYPAEDELYSQVGDDRDHIGFKKPSKDSAVYDKNMKGRPVYFCTGEPQGLKQYKNQSQGKASLAGKFASAFVLGSQLLADKYPDFSKKLKKKAIDAYSLGKRYPGQAQGACCNEPFYYAEDNWVDDMELAAIQLFILTKDKRYLDDAIMFGKLEKTTPWMGSDMANHYQWYPFINLGHYWLSSIDSSAKKEFNEFFKSEIEKVYNHGKDNPFLMGVPFLS